MSNHKKVQQIMLKATRLENKLASQRLKLASDLLKLKYKEVLNNFECKFRDFVAFFNTTGQNPSVKKWLTI